MDMSIKEEPYSGEQRGDAAFPASSVSSPAYSVYAGAPCYVVVNNKRVYRKISPSVKSSPTSLLCAATSPLSSSAYSMSPDELSITSPLPANSSISKKHSAIAAALSKPITISDTDEDVRNVTAPKKSRPSVRPDTGWSGCCDIDSSSQYSSVDDVSTQTETAMMCSCKACGIHFEDYMLYVLHASLHDPVSQWKCAQCGFQCGDKYSFTSHIMQQLKHGTHSTG